MTPTPFEAHSLFHLVPIQNYGIAEELPQFDGSAILQKIENPSSYSQVAFSRATHWMTACSLHFTNERAWQPPRERRVPFWIDQAEHTVFGTWVNDEFKEVEIKLVTFTLKENVAWELEMRCWCG